LDTAKMDLYIDDVLVAKNGGRHAAYREEQGVAAMQKPEFTVRAVLNRGKAEATVWTCDFSFDYVKINAEYRTGFAYREKRNRKNPGAAGGAAPAAAPQDRLEGERRLPLALVGPPRRGRLAAAGAPRAPHQALRPARHRQADRARRAEHAPVPRRPA